MIPAEKKSGLGVCSNWCTLTFTSLSWCKSFPSKCFFSGLRRWKSLSARCELYGGCTMKLLHELHYDTSCMELGIVIEKNHSHWEKGWHFLWMVSFTRCECWAVAHAVTVTHRAGMWGSECLVSSKMLSTTPSQITWFNFWFMEDEGCFHTINAAFDVRQWNISSPLQPKKEVHNHVVCREGVTDGSLGCGGYLLLNLDYRATVNADMTQHYSMWRKPSGGNDLARLQRKWSFSATRPTPHCPNLATSNFYLFTTIIKHFKGKQFQCDYEMRADVYWCSHTLSPNISAVIK